MDGGFFFGAKINCFGKKLEGFGEILAFFQNVGKDCKELAFGVVFEGLFKLGKGGLGVGGDGEFLEVFSGGEGLGIELEDFLEEFEGFFWIAIFFFGEGEILEAASILGVFFDEFGKDFGGFIKFAFEIFDLAFDESAGMIFEELGEAVFISGGAENLSQEFERFVIVWFCFQNLLEGREGFHESINQANLVFVF